MRTRRPGLAGGLLAAVLLAGAPVQAAEDVGLIVYRDRIEQAYNARDNAGIASAREELQSAGRDRGEEHLATYYAAYSYLRQATLAGDNKAQARDALEECIGLLSTLLLQKPDYAEARALYASCLGASSTYYVLRAASRGMQAGREMATAVKIAPDNPWVVFQDGVSDYSTPPLFGGDKDRALIKLRRAAGLFEASRPPGSSQPVFGEVDTWLYIGRSLAATGQSAEAREALETAQRYAPDSRDVAEALASL